MGAKLADPQLLTITQDNIAAADAGCAAQQQILCLLLISAGMVLGRKLPCRLKIARAGLSANLHAGFHRASYMHDKHATGVMLGDRCCLHGGSGLVLSAVMHAGLA